MATHSSLLAWETPWTEKPGGLKSMGSQRVGHDWVTKPPQPYSGKVKKKKNSSKVLAETRLKHRSFQPEMLGAAARCRSSKLQMK